jgi:hypothetical protein
MRESARLLRVRDHVQHQRRLAGRFRAKNLDHAPARQPSHAQRQVNANARSGSPRFAGRLRVAQSHDAPFAVRLCDARIAASSSRLRAAVAFSFSGDGFSAGFSIILGGILATVIIERAT